MIIAFYGMNPPNLSNHQTVKAETLDDLARQKADISIISSSVTDWRDVRLTGKYYLVAKEISLEIIEEAEKAGYAGVWSMTDYPVRLAALLKEKEKPVRRSLERHVEMEPEEVPEKEGAGETEEGQHIGHVMDSYSNYLTADEPEERPQIRKTRTPAVSANQTRRQPVKRERLWLRRKEEHSDVKYIPQQYVPRQVIVFNSTGGGKGKSTIAAATAVMLASDDRFRVRIAAVDFDFFSGTLAYKLGTAPRYTILDWIDGAVDDITRCMVPVELPFEDSDNSIMVLSGPEREEDGSALTGEVAQNLINILQRRFDIILIDTCSELIDSTIVALDYADHVFLLDTPDATSLRNTLKRATTLFDLGYGNKVHMVLNRVPKQSVMRLDVINEIPSATDPIFISEDLGVQVAINRQELLGLSRRAKKFSKAMEQILEEIVPNYAAPKKEGFFNFFRRKGVASV